MYMNIQTYRNIYIYLFIWKGRERNICIYTYIIFIYLYNYSISTHVKPSNFGGIAPWSRKNALESYSLNCSWVHWLYILLVYEGVRLYIYIYARYIWETFKTFLTFHFTSCLIWILIIHGFNKSPKNHWVVFHPQYKTASRDEMITAPMILSQVTYKIAMASIVESMTCGKLKLKAREDFWNLFLKWKIFCWHQIVQ